MYQKDVEKQVVSNHATSSLKERISDWAESLAKVGISLAALTFGYRWLNTQANSDTAVEGTENALVPASNGEVSKHHLGKRLNCVTAVPDATFTSGINVTSSNSIATFPNGISAVAWSNSNGNVYVQKLINGKVDINSAPFQVNTPETLFGASDSNSGSPFLLPIDETRALSLWISANQTGVIRGFARVIDINGTTPGAIFQVNSNAVSNILYLNAAKLTNGQYLLSWTTTNGVDGNLDGVSARLLDNNFNPLYSDLVVDTTTTGMQGESTIAPLNNGTAAIFWTSQTGDGSGTCVRAVLVNSAGKLMDINSDFLVNTNTNGNQDQISAAADVNTGISAAVWVSEYNPAATSIQAQVFDANGNKINGEINLASVLNTNGAAAAPYMAYAGQGRFLALWVESSLAAPNENTVQGQFLDSTGALLGVQFSVMQQTGAYVNVAAEFTSQNNLIISAYDIENQRVHAEVNLGTAEIETLCAISGTENEAVSIANNVIFKNTYPFAPLNGITAMVPEDIAAFNCSSIYASQITGLGTGRVTINATSATELNEMFASFNLLPLIPNSYGEYNLTIQTPDQTNITTITVAFEDVAPEGSGSFSVPQCGSVELDASEIIVSSVDVPYSALQLSVDQVTHASMTLNGVNVGNNYFGTSALGNGLSFAQDCSTVQPTLTMNVFDGQKTTKFNVNVNLTPGKTQNPKSNSNSGQNQTTRGLEWAGYTAAGVVVTCLSVYAQERRKAHKSRKVDYIAKTVYEELNVWGASNFGEDHGMEFLEAIKAIISNMPSSEISEATLLTAKHKIAMDIVAYLKENQLDYFINRPIKAAAPTFFGKLSDNVLAPVFSCGTAKYLDTDKVKTNAATIATDCKGMSSPKIEMRATNSKSSTLV